MSNPVNAIFVLEWIEFSFNLPYKIMDGLTLRKSTSAEEEEIKKFWDENSSAYIGSYKYNVKKGSTLSSVHTEDRDKWRYWLIEFVGNFDKYMQYQHAFNLLNFDLHLGLIVKSGLKNGFHLWHNQTKLYNYFQDEENIYLTKLYKRNFVEMPLIYKLIQDLNPSKHTNIIDALTSYEDTKLISNSVKFKVIAYFTIIEGLLTHNPNDPTNIDSITRQITNKVELINNRLNDKIDFVKWFGSVNNKKIFSKLYAYRSTIAHGGTIDFSKEFAIFKDSDYILSFIKYLTKKVLIASINEPDLINDLKNC